jgi:ATP-binding cassette, subfamily A (ABC1), member 3
MDECEYLCNRLAIMNQGNFTCIGDIQKLKNKYGRGFTLMIKLNETTEGEEMARNELKEDILKTFSGELKDEHGVSL